MRISSLVLILYLLVNITVSAQVTVKGKIVDQNGRGIEYVTISVDSLLAISDAEGNYEINVPDGHVSNMIFHHIAYRPYQLPYDVYKMGTQNVQLEENAYELSNVIVSKLRNVHIPLVQSASSFMRSMIRNLYQYSIVPSI